MDGKEPITDRIPQPLIDVWCKNKYITEYNQINTVNTGGTGEFDEKLIYYLCSFYHR